MYSTSINVVATLLDPYGCVSNGLVHPYTSHGTAWFDTPGDRQRLEVVRNLHASRPELDDCLFKLVLSVMHAMLMAFFACSDGKNFTRARLQRSMLPKGKCILA